MKLLHFMGLAIALAGISTTARAHDSFNIGITLGNAYPYAAPVVAYPGIAYPAIPHHRVPQVIYYDVPRMYQPFPYAYHPAPAITYYERAPRHSYSRHRHHSGHGHGAQRHGVHGPRGHFR